MDLPPISSAPNKGPSLQSLPGEKPKNPAKAENYVLQYDPLLSAETGAANIYTFYNLTQTQGLDRLFALTSLEEKWYGRFTRLILAFPFALWSGGVQHEVFGHGYRDREGGLSEEFDLKFWNFKWGQSLTNAYPEDYPILDEILSVAGGTEATQVLANYIDRQMFLTGGNFKNALFYIDTKLDFTNYICNWNNPSHKGILTKPDFYIIPEDDITLPAGDVYGYWEDMSLYRLEYLENKYGLEKVIDENLWDGPGFSYNLIWGGAIWNALDPTLLFSIYQSIKYLAKGSKEFKVPSFLPRTNFALTPVGPQFSLSLPFKTSQILIDPHIATTFFNDEISDYTWLGVDVLNIPATKWLTFDVGMDLWLRTQEREQSLEKGGANVDLGVKINPLNWLSLKLGGGYKTAGYVFPLPMEKGFRWSGALEAHF